MAIVLVVNGMRAQSVCLRDVSLAHTHIKAKGNKFTNLI